MRETGDGWRLVLEMDSSGTIVRFVPAASRTKARAGPASAPGRPQAEGRTEIGMMSPDLREGRTEIGMVSPDLLVSPNLHDFMAGNASPSQRFLDLIGKDYTYGSCGCAQ